MAEAVISFRPVGIIRSKHTDGDQTPIQPVYAKGCDGRAEIFAEFAEGLLDIEGFSHLYLIYYFDRAGPASLIVKPFLDDIEHGVFATRFPCRPNAIGLSVVELIRREDNILYLGGLDVLDRTPLLDIKPYRPKFDVYRTASNGWYDHVGEKTDWQRGRRGNTGKDAS